MKSDRRKSSVAGVAGTILVAALLLLIPALARAATITVTTMDDPTGPSGTCALRDAITAANTMTATNNCSAGTGTDTINFSVSGTIDLGSTLPAITNTSPDSLTIDGTGQSITISGQNLYQVMVFATGTLKLANLTIANGNAGGDGGGIASNGNGNLLTVTDCTFANNSASSGSQGGGISNDGTLTVTNSTFVGNGTPCCNGGAGIASGGGAITIVTNSTFASNSAPGGDGGGIQNNGSLTVTNSTFVGNSADFGGGISAFNGSGTLKGTLLADEASGGNCDGSITDGGYNL
jgi:CSLREA domain-containing protein